jgi:hypothetical protein
MIARQVEARVSVSEDVTLTRGGRVDGALTPLLAGATYSDCVELRLARDVDDVP